VDLMLSRNGKVFLIGMVAGGICTALGFVLGAIPGLLVGGLVGAGTRAAVDWV
jgi:hypothetical protein